MEKKELKTKIVDLPSIFINPDNPMEIKIPLFEGPLDLLLHLIRKKEVPISEVSLSELTGSYLDYIEKLQSINLDLAGDFLEIAAILILIKSRSLLPKTNVEIEDFEEEDPEEILRRRLLEYQHYKDAAFGLSSRDLLGRDVFQRPENIELIADNEENDPEYEDVTIYALLEAFERVVRRMPKVSRLVIETETIRVEDCIEELIILFGKNKLYLFDELFEKNREKVWLIVTFISILEMVRLRLVNVIQIEPLGAIHCTTHKDFEKNCDEWFIIHNRTNTEEEQLLRAS